MKNHFHLRLKLISVYRSLRSLCGVERQIFSNFPYFSQANARVVPSHRLRHNHFYSLLTQCLRLSVFAILYHVALIVCFSVQLYFLGLLTANLYTGLQFFSSSQYEPRDDFFFSTQSHSYLRHRNKVKIFFGERKRGGVGVGVGEEFHVL